MPLSLNKGGSLSLNKEAPNLTIARVGLGWDARATTGTDFDLDASAILVTSAGKVSADSDFIFFNQMQHPSGAVTHQGDNRTGAGDGDDEQIVVDLTKVPSNTPRIILGVSIHEGTERGQSFGQVRNAYIRLVDELTGVEVVRYDLSEDFGTETAVNFAELYQHNGEWKFKAVGQGYSGGLRSLGEDFGLNFG
jgi:tellurium resistance protein TerD